MQGPEIFTPTLPGWEPLGVKGLVTMQKNHVPNPELKSIMRRPSDVQAKPMRWSAHTNPAHADPPADPANGCDGS